MMQSAEVVDWSLIDDVEKTCNELEEILILLPPPHRRSPVFLELACLVASEVTPACCLDTETSHLHSRDPHLGTLRTFRLKQGKYALRGNLRRAPKLALRV
jgi:hypothetical protein